jgi:hypothetical protein
MLAHVPAISVSNCSVRECDPLCKCAAVLKCVLVWIGSILCNCILAQTNNQNKTRTNGE